MSVYRAGTPLDFNHNINLENLESIQDTWIKAYEGSKHPPAFPTLNSPRSLKACELCGVSAATDLRKYSLRLHLQEIIGKCDTVDQTVAELYTRENVRVAMQEALYAFQHAGISIGTSKEKLLAYRAFRAEEETRLERLAAVREVRRQLISEETYERRRQMHGNSTERRRNDSRRGSATKREPSWSATVSAHPPLIPSTPDREVAQVESAPFFQFSARAKPSGALPYTPRDANALNSSYFGNRHVSEDACNPSRSPVPVESPPRFYTDSYQNQSADLNSVQTVHDLSVQSVDSNQLDWILHKSPSTAPPPRRELPQKVESIQKSEHTKSDSEILRTDQNSSQDATVSDARPSQDSHPRPRHSLPEEEKTIPHLTQEEIDQGIVFYCVNPRF
ncbi:hypothetical protein ADEAN_000235800 [Angomonas deanei]|uniref:Uncharacterized protein n=1 Tax=Angomonas deanei TaxID=59799 RepID=A0A7G2C5Y0_9TRYP|nr:hypothetical protein ADEAN_000235800 [Angomonas deanei]